MPVHQYDYIFAIGTIFAFLDAWNIGTSPSLRLSVSLGERWRRSRYPLQKG
jgi:hypothetical protein